MARAIMPSEKLRIVIVETTIYVIERSPMCHNFVSKSNITHIL